MNSIILSLSVVGFTKSQFESSEVLKINAKLGNFPLSVIALGKLASTKVQPNDNILVTGSLRANGQISLIASKLEVVPTIIKINHLCISGHVGKATETRHLESGKVVANCSLAVRRSKEETDWFKIVAWERQAELVTNYVDTGNIISVAGRLVIETWTAQDSSELRTKPGGQVEQISFLARPQLRKDQQEELEV